MIKIMFDTVYAVLFLLAVLVGFYATKHVAKNKAMLFIEDLATAFVHQAETTDLHGQDKMSNVLNSVEAVLEKNHIKVDPIIESAIKAFAEQEVAKMNEGKK
ncbi:phage holin, LLH family [Lactobacillus sp. ESL0677]|uniref:phage holin, LLH family n=1 Tax=Lactobacillus sp. ESL0677 TaxID=2983208 RepID=UPI0023F83F29|nr:phage holin, LLH family [Lactobacillus sp. ESL0677]WEV37749.1 phage holin, LLH family [Lactobacillus sp. ESL0677]